MAGSTDSTIALGKSGLRVTRVCFGTWQMGQTFWGKQPEDVLIESVRAGLDAGVNFFDTADAYGDGTAERILGKALKGIPRDRFVLATKVYHHFYPDGHRHPDLSGPYITKACENSLKRLGTDCIDLYQCHSYDPLAPMEEVAEAMESLREQGKIRAFGLSNFSLEQLKWACACGNFSTIQPLYNLLTTSAENDLLPYCRRKNIGVLAYSPLANGLLTGKYGGTETFSDFRKDRPAFQGERFLVTAQRVRSLEAMVDRYGMSITQLVLTATCMHPAVHCVIVGIKKPEQIREAAAVVGKTVSREDYHRIRATLS